MREICNICNVPTAEAKPPKFSPDDKYGKYRRMAKFNEGADNNVGDNSHNDEQ